MYKGSGMDGAPVVVKAPRYMTEDLLTQFEVELQCLSALAHHDTVDARGGDEVPLVPQLLPGAMRLLVEGAVHPSHRISVPWPVLVFTEPINAVPLLRVLTGRKYRTLATRVELANVVARRLLQTAKVCLMLPPGVFVFPPASRSLLWMCWVRVHSWCILSTGSTVTSGRRTSCSRARSLSRCRRLYAHCGVTS